MDRRRRGGRETGADFFRKHTTDVLDNVLAAAAGKDPAELADRLGAHGIRLNKKFYPLLRFGARKLNKATVGKAGRLVNCLTFGKGLSKKALKSLKKEPLLPYVRAVFLCVFDGSASLRTWEGWTEDAKTIVLDVGTLPGRIVKKLPLGRAKQEKLLKTTGGIETLVTELMHPAAPDNTESVIEL